MRSAMMAMTTSSSMSVKASFVFARSRAKFVHGLLLASPSKLVPANYALEFRSDAISAAWGRSNQNATVTRGTGY